MAEDRQHSGQTYFSIARNEDIGFRRNFLRQLEMEIATDFQRRRKQVAANVTDPMDARVQLVRLHQAEDESVAALRSAKKRFNREARVLGYAEA